jgi:hypothetical protein
MPRDAPRAGPPATKEPARHVQQTAKSTEPRSRVTVARSVDELAARRELRSWSAAAAWLNQQGYAAAVPEHLAEALRRRGLMVWAAGGRQAA